MPEIQRQAVVGYTSEQMFDLVNDVTAYPQFLPWCQSVEILAQNDATMQAKISLGFAGMRQVLTTENTLSRPTSLTMQMLSGPLRSFHGVWRFVDKAEGCQVSLDMHFRVRTGLQALLFGKALDKAANQMVTAFVRRANHVYG